jgi:glycosyltransferase involved in cell wall biosynthesis
MPLVSVIMNVRNGAQTLREAIDSVLAQTFQDWELIVWDDRSTDNSAAIVAEYRDARIRYYLSPQDVPLGKARADAIRKATSEWIAFLDQDDVWLPHKLESQLALAQNEDDVGLIYGRTVRFYPSGLQRDYDQAHEYKPLPDGDIFSQLFTDSCFIAMSSAMFRRSAIESIGGIPDEIRIIPDYYLYVAVARRYRARAVQEVVCRYRMHADSMSHTAALEMHHEVLWLIDRWADQLDPQTVAACRRRHFTAIALEEMRSRTTLGRGIVRLLTQGSLASQLLRPFAFLFHVARRNLRPPVWRRLGSKSSV